MSAVRYAELQCTTHFSFLRGASSCEDLFAKAAQLGLEALAITDRNSPAGIVRAHEAAKATGVRHHRVTARYAPKPSPGRSEGQSPHAYAQCGRVTVHHGPR
jgi:DNA polymerase III alpha subunit